MRVKTFSVRYELKWFYCRGFQLFETFMRLRLYVIPLICALKIHKGMFVNISSDWKIELNLAYLQLYVVAQETISFVFANVIFSPWNFSTSVIQILFYIASPLVKINLQCLKKIDKYTDANKPKNSFSAFIVKSVTREKRSITITTSSFADLLARDSPGRIWRCTGSHRHVIRGLG